MAAHFSNNTLFARGEGQTSRWTEFTMGVDIAVAHASRGCLHGVFNQVYEKSGFALVFPFGESYVAPGLRQFVV